MYSTFQSVDSVYQYLVESTPQPTVKPASKKPKQPSKEKTASISTPSQAGGEIQVLAKGRVR